MKTLVMLTLFIALVIPCKVLAEIIHIELPQDIKVEQLENLDAKTRERLNKLATEEIKKKTPPPTYKDKASKIESAQVKEQQQDFKCAVIIYTKNGNPIFPQVSKVLQQEKNSTKVPSTNELNFTYNAIYTAEPWTDEELADLQNFIQKAYPIIKEVYGPPLWNGTVNIRKEPESTVVGAYFPPYDIGLRSTKHDVVVHEIIHAFHDGYIGTDNYEEGMTRAAEVIVMGKLQETYWDENHSYYIDVYYENLNKYQISQPGGIFPYIYSLTFYQIAGYAWGKLYLEDTNFFKNFNVMYYDKIVNKDKYNLEDIVFSVKSTAEGKPIEEWYEKQHIFRTKWSSQHSGKTLFVKADDNYNTVIGYISKNNYTGNWTPIPNTMVDIKLYKYDGTALGELTKSTNQYGSLWFSFGNGSQYEVNIGTYTGRVKIVAKATDDNVDDFSYSYVGDSTAGLFGITVTGNSGSVTIDGVGSVNVTNGTFIFPTLENQAGTFTLKYVDENGKQTTRTVTKDASRYFTMVDFEYERPLVPEEQLSLNLTFRNSVFNPIKGEPVTIIWSQSNDAVVQMQIYNLLGELVTTLIENVTYPEGANSIKWHGKNKNEEIVASGVYVVRIKVGKESTWKKIAVVK